MDLGALTGEQRLEFQRKRVAYFKGIAEKYNSIQDFIKDNEEKFAILGIELSGGEESASLYIQLDFTDYEQYDVIQTPSGQLTCSHIIWWKDEWCCTSFRNVITGEDVDDEDEIWKEY